MAQLFSRWTENYGEDPISRQTLSIAPARSGQPFTVAVDHVPQPAPPYTPGYTPPGGYTGPALPAPSTIEPPGPALLLSQESGIAPFETLFSDFNLQAVPVYNFWEKDEESSSHERGNQNPDDLPRYVRLLWDPAPDLRDPDEFKKHALLARSDPNARDVFTQLSPFGFGSHQIVGTIANGVAFTPEHLQPSHFEQNAKAVANGHVFSGIAEAVVSVATASLLPLPMPTSHLVDEDEYLADYTRWWGIPFAEFNSALWRWRSTMYGAQQVLNAARLSPAGSLMQQYLFTGKYGIAPYAGSTSYSLAAVNASSPAISLYGNTAESYRYTPPVRVMELGEPLLQMSGQPNVFQYVKAKLIHTNLMGLMDSTRASAATQAHFADAIAALAPLAGNLAVYAQAGAQHYSREVSIPSFVAPDTIKPLEYIGYVIEKWELQDGAYKLVNTFYIPGREYTDYVDAAVKYGVSYRYRIRAVLRWSRPHGISVFGKDPTVIDPPGVAIASLTPNDVSYFASEWGQDWAYSQLIDRSPPPPPDELIVQPHSEPDPETGKPYVVVSFRLPYNPQRDINKMTLYRKMQDADGVDQTGWVQVQEFRENLDDPTRQGTRHLYETSYQHEQDDITGTKFRASETDRVETFVEYGPTSARFEDHAVDYFGTGNTLRYVYAAVCLTRHGEKSALSDQLGVRLNPDWKKSGELPIDFVSCAGVHPDFDTGIFSTYPERRIRDEVIFRQDPKTGAPGVVGLAGQERRANKMISSANYVMRVESLDTGQHVDVPVALTIKNMPAEVSTLPLVALVARQR